MEWLMDGLTQVSVFISDNAPEVFSYATLAIRLILPVFAAVIVWRCIRSLLGKDYDLEQWGQLSLPNGAVIPLNHWENIIGRSRSSDVSLQYPSVSRSHAGLIRDDRGNWRLYDLNSKSGVFLNGSRVDGSAEIIDGDIMELGGAKMMFFEADKSAQSAWSKQRERPGKEIKASGTLLYLTAFQLALGLQFCIAYDNTLTAALPLSFLALIALTWGSYIITRLMRRVAFEIETLAFFLCTLGLAVVATSAPENVYRQLLLITGGVILYYLFGGFLRDLTTAVKLRWPLAAAGLLLLGATLVLSDEILGAKNWLSLGDVSFQPSEFVKLAFVSAGAATLDRLFARRNLVLFIAFSGVCVMTLALMGDFGTALVFFVAYLTIAFLRSGNLATLILSVAGAGLAGLMAVVLRPYVAGRFTAWGHAWENTYSTGYQQTRAMSASASGGLFGVGGGNGWFKNVFAADTDMVFGILSEELGLIIAVAAVFSLLVLAFYAVRTSVGARSTYYVIGACAASSILLTQMILNVFGSVDILPFTGVTFPFVSTGGSSLVASWGLIAFIKAADTRQNASFAVVLPKTATKRGAHVYDNEAYNDEYDEFDDYNEDDDLFEEAEHGVSDKIQGDDDDDDDNDLY